MALGLAQTAARMTRPHGAASAWAKSRESSAHLKLHSRRFCPPYRRRVRRSRPNLQAKANADRGTDGASRLLRHLRELQRLAQRRIDARLPARPALLEMRDDVGIEPQRHLLFDRLLFLQAARAAQPTQSFRT